MFTPYLWAAGMKGTVALGPVAPAVSVDQSFSDILGSMKMGFMGAFEIRNGKWGFVNDLNYLYIAVSATGPAGFVNGELHDKTFFGTFLGTYRLFDQSNGWLDLTGGARIWWRNTQLTITAPGPVALDVTREKSWVDPVIGLRARAYLSPQYFTQISGDYGGFGVGAHSDWQIEGIIGYEINSTKSFFIGYRHLEVDYKKNGYQWDVKLSGPVMGGTFKF